MSGTELRIRIIANLFFEYKEGNKKFIVNNEEYYFPRNMPREYR